MAMRKTRSMRNIVIRMTMGMLVPISYAKKRDHQKTKKVDSMVQG